MTNASAISAVKSDLQLATDEIVLRKLLVAVDFSSQTPQVFKTAIAVANCYNSEPWLVNAATPVVAETMLIDSYEVNLEIAKARMASLIKSEPELRSIRHHEIVVYAKAMDLVQQVVADEKIDLVITGSHGANALEHAVLGSVAESILRHVNCPALIVGPHAQTLGNPFRSILYATDLNVGGLRGAQYASGLAERFHGKLTMLHVVEPTSKARKTQSELTESHIRRTMERLLPPDFSAYGKATIRVGHGKAGDIISDVARCEATSLIVMGIRENAIFADHTPWSTLSHVVHESLCPVLCVRHHLV